MIRNLLAMTALAATTFAVPAFAETSVHVTLTGKTQAEAYAAIVNAARTVCETPVFGDAHSIYSVDACVQDTVAATLTKSKLTAPTAASASTPAPAASTSVRVSLVGKSPAEAYAAIKDAANTVCSVKTPGVFNDAYSMEACVRSTVAVAVRKAQSPALSKIALGAGYELASN